MYLLDTNACSQLIRGRGSLIRRRFDDALATGAIMAVSCITVYELAFGIEKSPPERAQENARRVRAFLGNGVLTLLPIEAEDAVQAAKIRDHLRRHGQMIGPYDLLIAGQALARGLAVVTANMGEFARVPGLPVEDWSAA